jgi:hypothetical protein
MSSLQLFFQIIEDFIVVLAVKEEDTASLGPIAPLYIRFQ